MHSMYPKFLEAAAAVDKHHLAHSSRLPNDPLLAVSRRCKDRGTYSVASRTAASS